MVKIARVSHALTLNGKTFGVTLPDIYDNIADVVGVKKQTAKQVVEAALTVNESRKNGMAVELKVTTTGKNHSILCAIDKVSSALGTLRDR